LFQEVTETFAPGTITAWLLGFTGFAIFWSVFGWPVYGLYQDFVVAASEVLSRQKTSLAAFPAGTLSMLLTSAVLAVLPMGVFLLFMLTLLTRSKHATACARALRTAHEMELQRLTNCGQLEVEISEPQIDACRVLLRIGKKSYSAASRY
jgi:hypothetical protein